MTAGWLVLLVLTAVISGLAIYEARRLRRRRPRQRQVQVHLPVDYLIPSHRHNRALHRLEPVTRAHVALIVMSHEIDAIDWNKP